MPMKNSRGFTLIELVVAVGVFAVVMTLVSGAYIVMIHVTQRAQGTSSGIDNLSFALETMTRTIRTGTDYRLIGHMFTVRNQKGVDVRYELFDDAIMQNNVPLTDPSVHVTDLTFALSGRIAGDAKQPYVTITIAGTVSTTAENSETFNIRTSAVMRAIDL